MARRRYGKKKGGYRSKKVSVTAVAPLIYMAGVAYTGYKAGGAKQMANDVVARTTGYSMIGEKFDASYAMPTLGVVVGSFLAHKIVAIAGVNRNVPKWMPIKF